MVAFQVERLADDGEQACEQLADLFRLADIGLQNGEFVAASRATVSCSQSSARSRAAAPCSSRSPSGCQACR